MKKIILLSALILATISTVSLMSFESGNRKSREFYFDKTASVEQMEQLRIELKKSGIHAEYKNLTYNELGYIQKIDMRLRSKGSYTRFCTDSFEHAEIKKNWFSISVSVNGENQEDLINK